MLRKTLEQTFPSVQGVIILCCFLVIIPDGPRERKLMVCCVQSISIQREVTLLGELQRVVQLSSPAREGTVSVQWQFRASDFKNVLFFEIAYETWLVAYVNRVYFPLHMPLYVYYRRADYDTSCWWLWNGIDLFEEKRNASPFISKVNTCCYFTLSYLYQQVFKRGNYGLVKYHYHFHKIWCRKAMGWRDNDRKINQTFFKKQNLP